MVTRFDQKGLFSPVIDDKEVNLRWDGLGGGPTSSHVADVLIADEFSNPKEISNGSCETSLWVAVTVTLVGRHSAGDMSTII